MKERLIEIIAEIERELQNLKGLRSELKRIKYPVALFEVLPENKI